MARMRLPHNYNFTQNYRLSIYVARLAPAVLEKFYWTLGGGKPRSTVLFMHFVNFAGSIFFIILHFE